MKAILFIILICFIFGSCATPEFGHTRKQDRKDKWDKSKWHQDYLNTGIPPIKNIPTLSH